MHPLILLGGERGGEKLSFQPFLAWIREKRKEKGTISRSVIEKNDACRDVSGGSKKQRSPVSNDALVQQKIPSASAVLRLGGVAGVAIFHDRLTGDG